MYCFDERSHQFLILRFNLVPEIFDRRRHRLFIDVPANDVLESSGPGGRFITSKGFGPGFSKNPFQ